MTSHQHAYGGGQDDHPEQHTGTGERFDEAVHAGHDSTTATAQHEHHHGDASAAHYGHGGHGGHEDHAAQFRDRFWWSLLLAVPVVGFSKMFSDLLGYVPPPGTDWISPVLGTVIFFYGGWPFLTGAVAEVRARQPGMMLLVSLAITVAFIASGATTLGIGNLDLDFWWELALLVVIMLLGHWLEMRALGQASSALDALAALLPDDADRVGGDGQVERVALDQLAAGDLVLVRSGGRVPADGIVEDGRAEVDESMITGESKAVSKGKGDLVVAGTVATDSALRVRVKAVGEQTALAGIRRLVEQAQSSRSRAQALADRAAAALFYFASIAGLITFLVWSLLGESDQAVERTVTVLVIACPHALGLAIPLVIAISTAMAAGAGILVKDRLALERMRTVDAVLFDKTGTLTMGRPAVIGAVATEDGEAAEAELLRLAAAVEGDSEHPLAQAVVTAAVDRGGVPTASDFRSMTGRGVQAQVGAETVAVGGPALLRETGAGVPDSVARAARDWSARGATVLYVLRSGRVAGALALADQIRPESRHAVDQLHRRRTHVVMITGDARAVAEAVGHELGVDEVFAEVLPEDKDSKVAELQSRGLRVAMVGDGVNDAPALARADVGLAIGAGTDVAIESAGVVLASDDPRGVLSVITLSVASYRKMRQNLAWATGYNVLTVPLAAGVLAPVGFVLPPAVGAIMMSLSTIVVAANAQLLRRVDLRPQDRTDQDAAQPTDAGAREEERV
ncbi:MAG: heavy metal translocating P-type ATPase [Mycobacteriales bacterium]